ncbi:MAG: short-chain dehydrogenase [Chloroflexi bacterium GWB2_49_20]|nr:MAG: short-chain dehydrogenase [Chloroflexi bacterium GWB2_49_20]OGN80272.1 MAG: short-chain dehydrogenase [Chloroflexi bacterium GWC2_49_37]OGN86088.1 MAG: short-chain dehydrogenase [Chloroflexi bacterium GWD2_49_16]HCC79392.1 NAD(P)-dependent oxidoreductase [Anaerolineae bacterium]HCM96387.1 NAD(P)-dependent oxidoreductase [Anaerolineae bacterium]
MSISSSPKTVLITGAAGGIGRATVHLFADCKWQVIGVDRAAFGPGFPESGLFIQSDISEPASLETIFQQAKTFSGRLDGLVNNAALQISKSLLETSVAEWDAVMASNLRSVFLSAKLAYPLFKAAGGGAIVNVSSVHAVQTSANIAAYAASKGGLLALTRAMAIEFAGDNIRVNAILPGAVDTPMLRAGLNREHVKGHDIHARLENLAGKTVNGRVGKPEEIAHAIYFLADETQSSFMTGQALIVDGGATARLSTE